MKSNSFQNILNFKEDNCFSSLFKIESTNILFDCGLNSTTATTTDFTILSSIQSHLSSITNLSLMNNSVSYLLIKEMIPQLSFSIRKLIDAIFNIKLNNEKIDYIFITDCSVNSIGMLPMIGKLFENVVIYTSTAIAKISYFIILDYYSHIAEIDNFSLFNELDLYTIFNNNVNEVSYYTNITLPELTNKIILKALPSGNCVGGIIIKMRYQLKDLIYAPFICFTSKPSCKHINEIELTKNNLFITDSSYLFELKSETEDNSDSSDCYKSNALVHEYNKNLDYFSNNAVNSHLTKHYNINNFNKKVQTILFEDRKHLILFSHNISQTFDLLLNVKHIINNSTLTTVNNNKKKNNFIYSSKFKKNNQNNAYNNDYKAMSSVKSMNGSTIIDNTNEIFNIYFILIGNYSCELIESYKTLTYWIPNKTKLYLDNKNDSGIKSQIAHYTHYKFAKSYKELKKQLLDIKGVDSLKDKYNNYSELEALTGAKEEEMLSFKIKDFCEELIYDNKLLVIMNCGVSNIDSGLFPEFLNELSVKKEDDYKDLGDDSPLFNLLFTSPVNYCEEYYKDKVSKDGNSKNKNHNNAYSNCTSTSGKAVSKKTSNADINKDLKDSNNNEDLVEKEKESNAEANNEELKFKESNLIDSLMTTYLCEYKSLEYNMNLREKIKTNQYNFEEKYDENDIIMSGTEDLHDNLKKEILTKKLSTVSNNFIDNITKLENSNSKNISNSNKGDDLFTNKNSNIIENNDKNNIGNSIEEENRMKKYTNTTNKGGFRCFKSHKNRIYNHILLNNQGINNAEENQSDKLKENTMIIENSEVKAEDNITDVIKADEEINMLCINFGLPLIDSELEYMRQTEQVQQDNSTQDLAETKSAFKMKDIFYRSVYKQILVKINTSNFSFNFIPLFENNKLKRIHASNKVDNCNLPISDKIILKQETLKFLNLFSPKTLLLIGYDNSLNQTEISDFIKLNFSNQRFIEMQIKLISSYPYIEDFSSYCSDYLEAKLSLEDFIKISNDNNDNDNNEEANKDKIDDNNKTNNNNLGNNRDISTGALRVNFLHMKRDRELNIISKEMFNNYKLEQNIKLINLKSTQGINENKDLNNDSNRISLTYPPSLLTFKDPVKTSNCSLSNQVLSQINTVKELENTFSNKSNIVFSNRSNIVISENLKNNELILVSDYNLDYFKVRKALLNIHK